jgi:4-amino-4-deoxy-L-arabinose transferase-like glycosyltransferase
MLTALAGLLYAPGFALERVFLRDISHLRFRGVMRLCLGTAFWTGAAFFLCAIHRFTVTATATLALIAVAGALPFVRPRSIRFPGGYRPASFVMAAGCLLPIIAALLVALISSMHPSLSWDANVYHLVIPKRYIAHEGFVFLPFNVYSNWPLNGELLFALAMLMRDYILANSVQWLFGVCSACAVCSYVRARHSIRFGFLAVLLMLFNASYYWEMRTAYVDIIYGFFLVAAFIFTEQALDDPDRRRPYLLLAGISGGLMAGIKVTGFAGVAPVTIYYLLRAAGQRQLRRGLREIGICFFLPVVILALPWVMKAAWYTGNPVYPFLYGVFGGPDWSPALTRQFVAWQSSIGMGRSIGDYILLPFRVILSAGLGYASFDGMMSPLWIVLLPITLVAAKWNRTVRSCLVIAGIYFVCWAVSSQQMRLLLPIIPILAIGAALAMGELQDRLITRRAVAAAAFTAIYGVASVLVVAEMRRLSETTGQAFALYRENDRRKVKELAVPPIFNFINRQLPSNAELVFFNINLGFHCERQYIADSCFEASQIADWLRSCSSPEEIALRLKSRGITHILYSTLDWHIEYPSALENFLNDNSLLELLGQSSDNKLFVFALK